MINAGKGERHGNETMKQEQTRANKKQKQWNILLMCIPNYLLKMMQLVANANNTDASVLRQLEGISHGPLSTMMKTIIIRVGKHWTMHFFAYTFAYA